MILWTINGLISLPPWITSVDFKEEGQVQMKGQRAGRSIIGQVAGHEINLEIEGVLDEIEIEISAALDPIRLNFFHPFVRKSMSQNFFSQPRAIWAGAGAQKSYDLSSYLSQLIRYSSEN